MNKKLCAVCFALAFTLIFVNLSVSMPLIGGYSGPDKLSNGLELTDFQVQGPTPAKTGNRILVTFRLINKSENIITFDPRYGVFIGARWNSTTNANNRDFGHNYKGATLMPLQAIVLQASLIPTQAGTWRFWPAFNVGGKWGPFRWHEVVVEVQQAHTSTQRPPRRSQPGP